MWLVLNLRFKKK